MEKKSNTKLRIIREDDYRFLFNLLKERESFMNISHKKMPTFSEHVKFIRSKPYTKWYIIENGKKKVGSIYLSKQNEIGIFIKKKHNQTLHHCLTYMTTIKFY